MFRGVLFGWALLGVSGCAHGGSSRAECPEVELSAALQADFEKGRELVTSCAELCMKSKEGGAKRSEGLSLLKTAAEKGYLDAQAFYGETKFSDLMTTGFEPELEAEYIEAIYFLALASKRGSAAARAALPELETLTLSKEGALSGPLTAPLSYINDAWVKAALKKAQAALACYPK